MTQINIEEEEFLEESNHIEGEYSDEALYDAKQTWIMAKVYIKYPISLDYILDLHRRLMKRLNTRIAGKIRDCAVYIGGDCRDQSKKDIIKQLNDWCKVFSAPNTEKEIKEAHVMFELIHPFEDGNGRIGRILMNLQRIKAKLPILIIHVGKEQMDYYKWFK